MAKYRIVKRNYNGSKPRYALVAEYHIKMKNALYIPVLTAASPTGRK